MGEERSLGVIEMSEHVRTAAMTGGREHVSFEEECEDEGTYQWPRSNVQGM